VSVISFDLRYATNNHKGKDNEKETAGTTDYPSIHHDAEHSICGGD
jgi:hypothetical protein